MFTKVGSTCATGTPDLGRWLTGPPSLCAVVNPGMMDAMPSAETPRGDSVGVVVISGLPASGKSSLARQIAPLLGLPVIDKDDILENSFPEENIDPTERHLLSRAADAILQQRVETTPRAVVASFWRHPSLTTDSGTPTLWLQQLPHLVEVHCVCSPATAAQRFLQRRRHPGHGDWNKTPGQVLAQFQELHGLGSLGVGPLIDVDTEIAVDPSRLAEEVRVQLTGS